MNTQQLAPSNFQFPNPFPRHAVPECFYFAMQEVSDYSKTPYELIFAEFLATSSLACQSLVNVRRPNGQSIPCAVWLLTLAESGERKSAVASIVSKPIKNKQDALDAQNKLDLEKYTFDHEIWLVQKKVLLKSIEKAMKKNESQDEFKLRLEEHERIKPVIPTPVKWLYEDTTPEAILYGMQHFGKSAGIFSDEGATVFSGHAMRNFSIFNTLWSGGQLAVDRRTTSSYVLTDARLTFSLMIQPDLMQKFIDKSGAEARSIGLLARFLTAYPKTTQGTRLIESTHQSWHHLSKFHKRIDSLLEETIRIIHEGKSSPKTDLKLSVEAARFWVDSFNSIEKQLIQGGALHDTKDYASKVLENVLRVAGIFHMIGGGEGKISLDTIARADVICRWYGDEFSRLFSSRAQMPEAQSDAYALEDWFNKQISARNIRIIKKQFIRQYGPNQLRQSKDRLNAAISWLYNEGKISIFHADAHGLQSNFKTEWLDLNVLVNNFWSQHNSKVLNSNISHRY